MNGASSAPLLCLGQVRHTRLRPAHHAFCYGLYFMRLPLRTLHAIPLRLPTLFSLNRFNLLSFHEKDHGDGQQPLLNWIDDLLRREGIHDADGEIWLQAFPRVFGYVFNPVAFWFCHRRDGALRAILAEVRNTFGEKHYYLLDTGKAMPYGIELHARKVFHVSPFCAISGTYRFRFMHTHTSIHDAPQQERVVARVDHDDAHGQLIQTSLSGIAVPLTNAAIVRAMLRYPFMTVGVVLRIHWQALQLWRKRVPFFSKPQPPSSELSK